MSSRWYSSVRAVSLCRVRRACPTVTTPVPTAAPPCTGTDRPGSGGSECYTNIFLSIDKLGNLLLKSWVFGCLVEFYFPLYWIWEICCMDIDNSEARLWIPIQIELNVMWFLTYLCIFYNITRSICIYIKYTVRTTVMRWSLSIRVDSYVKKK